MAAIVITKENFDSEVVKADGTVLVDFWATWCGPCRMLSPIVDAVASEHPEVKVGKINVDEQPELAQQFGIMSIPTLIVFKNGAKVNESIGLVPKEKVEELIGCGNTGLSRFRRDGGAPRHLQYADSRGPTWSIPPG